jgi:hypothetical protein
LRRPILEGKYWPPSQNFLNLCQISSSYAQSLSCQKIGLNRSVELLPAPLVPIFNLRPK